jgi:hypothetical protein
MQEAVLLRHLDALVEEHICVVNTEDTNPDLIDSALALVEDYQFDHEALSAALEQARREERERIVGLIFAIEQSDLTATIVQAIREADDV